MSGNKADSKALTAMILELAAMMAAVRPLVGDHMLKPEVLQRLDLARESLLAGGMVVCDVDRIPGLEPPGEFSGTESLDREALSGAEVVWLAEQLGAVPPTDLYRG
jgi:hypothetical protein